jgi:hypothetical protein
VGQRYTVSFGSARGSCAVPSETCIRRRKRAPYAPVLLSLRHVGSGSRHPRDRSASHDGECQLNISITIRRYVSTDAPQVRQLLITVNRLLAPPHLQEAFESYIVRALIEEIDRIEDYYAERAGGFWVATFERRVVGMFGLERIGGDEMELRRMYVEPSVRRDRGCPTTAAVRRTGMYTPRSVSARTEHI